MSSLTPVHLLPPSATHEEVALSQATARLADLAPHCRQMWNPATCPPAHLPWLAWALSVDEWDSAWSDAQKRAAIEASYTVHRHKGTVGAMRAALAALGYSISITEWFRESPPAAPYTFGLTADLDDRGINGALWDSIEGVALATMNVRSHMRYIRLRATDHGRFHVGGTAVAAEIVRVDPFSLPELQVAGAACIALALCEHDITTVFPPGDVIPVLLLQTGAPLELASGATLRLMDS